MTTSNVALLDISNVNLIVDVLTDEQKQCILNLTDTWCDEGYSKVTADLIYATDSRVFPCRFGPLVECRWHDPEDLYVHYQHRLLPLGVEVKNHLSRR